MPEHYGSRYVLR